MVYIFDEICKVQQTDIQLMESLLSKQRTEQLSNCKSNEAKKTSIISYCLLRVALWIEYGIETLPIFDYSTYFKPSFRNYRDIEFSFSHCSHGVACALSKFSIGIDMETSVDFYLEIYPSVLSHKECKNMYLSKNPQKYFTELWTMKEAVGKYMGTGLMYDLKSTDFCVAEKQWVKIKNIYLFTLYNKSYAVSVCSKEVLEIKHIDYYELIKNIIILHNKDNSKREEI